jgi:signal transduction histidine kinase
VNFNNLPTTVPRQSHDERLIAAGRAVLAGFFLLAIWLDPSEPSRYARLTYTLLAVYLGYAVVLALAIWHLVTPGRVLPIVTHALDLLVFTVIMFLTQGPTSPFFVYFIFSLVCATLRWQWRGTLWTALASLVVVGFLALYSADLWSDPHYELNRVIIRLVYLSVTAVLLGYLGAHELKLRQEHYCLLAELRQGAAAEERVRLARDLHDGLLQSLTGMALQLETVRRLLESDPQTAKQRLLEIQQLIAAEQRDLRVHIRDLKPAPPGVTTDPRLAERLEGLGERLKRQWGLTVAVGSRHPGRPLSGTLAQEIYWIVHESLINAARHARASGARAEIAVEDHRVSIRVEDDGQGFPFQGRYTLGQLAESKLGPATLMERIASLGGALTLDSGDRGTRLDITLPLREGES